MSQINVLACSLLVLISAAFGTVVQVNIYGSNNNGINYDGNFGRTGLGGGDLDGDGITDFVVGANNYGDWCFSSDPSCVETPGAIIIILMNADLSVKSSFPVTHDTHGDLGFVNYMTFGSACALVDVDADGDLDFVVGVKRDNAVSNYNGAVWILQNDGTGNPVDSTYTVFRPDVDTANIEYGDTVCSLGDFDDNGFDDFAVGSLRYRDTNTNSVGALFIELVGPGITSLATYKVLGSWEEGRFTEGIAPLGDLDFNGVPDVFVTTYDDSLWAVFMEADGSPREEEIGVQIARPSSVIARASRAGNIGDLDFDGIDEMILGSEYGGTLSNSGAVHILFLTSDALIRKSVDIDHSVGGIHNGVLISNQNFGQAVAGVGDVDGDNILDILVGTHQNDVYLILMASSGGVKQCLDNACANGTPCYESGVAEYTCNCTDVPFLGTLCDEPDDCVGVTACNTGLCVDGNSATTCDCSTVDYSGEFCDVWIDDCASTPCANGGICTDGVRSFTCDCDAIDYTGATCGDWTDDCLLESCSNGGACIDAVNTILCDCTGTGHADSRCSSISYSDDCQSSPCLAGICADLGLFSYSCVCDGLGMIGPNCDIIDYEDDCATGTNPCMNNGTCIDLGVLSSECDCSTTFDHEGTFCQTRIDDCVSHLCENEGSCVDGDKTYSCDCSNTGYSGQYCTDVSLNDDCTSSPCNAGLCTDQGLFAFTCDCTNTGYQLNSTYCTEPILNDDCVPSPCLNNGTCIDIGAFAFECACDGTGYTGTFCDIDDYTDDCASSPCLNNGVCTDTGVLSVDCNCTNTGYNGTYCDDLIDECASSPCLNNGKCTDAMDAYSCECFGASGANCENINYDDDCISNPCLNDGVCVDAGAYYFICECLEGFSGTICDGDANECSSNPCQNNGTCSDAGFNDYFCDCTDTGYTGKTCDSVSFVDDCATNLCMNEGRCVDHGLFNFSCDCSAVDYDGEFCTQGPIDNCDGAACQNGGVCIDSIQDYLCDCDGLDYDGVRCQSVIDDCVDHNCLNGGACVDGHLSYTCNCSNVFWSGEFCETIECNDGVQISDTECDCEGTDTTDRYCAIADESCSDISLFGTRASVQASNTLESLCPLGARCIDCGVRCASCEGVIETSTGYIRCSPVDSCSSTITDDTSSLNGGFMTLCEDGYTGDDCRACTVNYFRRDIDSGCVPCPNVGGSYAMLIVIALSFALFGFVNYVNVTLLEAFAIACQFVQLFVLITGLPLRWDAVASSLHDELGLFMLDFTAYGGTPCLFPSLTENESYVVFNVILTLIPLVLVLLAVLVYNIQKGSNPEALSACVQRIMLASKALYIPVIVRLWSHFHCDLDPVLNEYVVRGANHITCQSSSWTGLAVYSGIMLILYGCALPCYAALVLLLRPRFVGMRRATCASKALAMVQTLVQKLNPAAQLDQQYMNREEFEGEIAVWSSKYFSVSAPFTSTCFYWAFTDTLHHFIMAHIVGVFGFGSAFIQGLFLLLGILAFVILTNDAKPYEYVFLNRFSLALNLPVIIVLTLGLLAEQAELRGVGNGAIVSFLFAATFIACAIALVYVFKNHHSSTSKSSTHVLYPPAAILKEEKVDADDVSDQQALLRADE